MIPFLSLKDVTELHGDEIRAAVERVVNKLMIVAHPDDETIWGGYHLSLSQDWLVVCVTYNKEDEPRGREFCEVIKKTGNVGVMLGFPDVNFGRLDRWLDCNSLIKEKLKQIIDSRCWDMIVTHNPDGEYSHLHHILISSIVTTITTKNLYYFGKYYERKEKTLKDLPKLDTEWVNKKKELMAVYQSQGVSANAFEHMYPYEYFIPYSEWKHYKKTCIKRLCDKIVKGITEIFNKIKWHLIH
jgi:LmbE family N-acetylglucosaminyl deacetylase